MVDLNLLPVDRFQMIYNGVDLSRVHTNHERGKAFRKKFGIPDDKYVIVQVSWIIPEKGISELLQTAKLVIDRNQDVFFVIVGEGVYRTQYMREAESLGIERNIRWTGLVKDPFDEGVFEAADVVCQLSNWEEVFGWMIAEGMAHAKPIVATSVGGIPELIKNGESGFLVARGDVTPTATALLTLLSDPALRRRFGDCGRWIVQEKFNLKTNVAQLMKTYGIPNDSAIGDNG
jgi:glycosyltransferase involved in cell wall biosynthesis